jgi:GNAT superfamily N-acetyltransferase
MSPESTASAEVLENPIWWGLRTRQSHLSLSYGRASRYDPEVSIFGGVSDFDDESWSDLAHLVPPNPVVRLIGDVPLELPSGWSERRRLGLEQMVLPSANTLEPDELAIRELTDDDVPQILELISLTRPGPFLPRTVETGSYFGHFSDGRLVAMAGERFKPEGFTEISAVCTHPDVRGRGFASTMSSLVAERIFERGETPFLYVATDNVRASSVYRKLGFETTRRHSVVEMKFTSRPQ